MNARVLIFAVIATLFASILFGVAPVILAICRDTGDALKDEGGWLYAGRKFGEFGRILIRGRLLCRWFY